MDRGDYLIHQDLFVGCMRHLAELAKFIRNARQIFNLFYERLGNGGNLIAELAFMSLSTHGEMLDCELHRSQRILDLMRDLFRHLLPGVIPFILSQILSTMLKLIQHAVVLLDQVTDFIIILPLKFFILSAQIYGLKLLT